jgi:Na+-transporting methylmalonyl-CoA/oxaloacetate decarboxylase gamma subunit
MTSNLILSLQITALGMGLVFGAILLLWLTMAILTALTADKEPALRHSLQSQDNASDSPQVASPPQADSKLQVALLAVALALAEQKQTSARPLTQPPMTLVSAWQLGMRMKQLADKGKITRR